MLSSIGECFRLISDGRGGYRDAILLVRIAPLGVSVSALPAPQQKGGDFNRSRGRDCCRLMELEFPAYT